MDFAVGPIAILLLLLPGLSYRIAYLKSQGVQRLNSTSSLTEVGMILGAAFIQHVGWWCLLEGVLHFDFRWDWFLALVSGEPDGAVIEANEKGIALFLGYLLGASAIGILLGKLQRSLFDRFDLTAVDSLWSYTGPWDDILSGRLFNREVSKATPVILVHALCEIEGKGIIYMGTLQGYYLNREGNLERLVIGGNVFRASLEELNGVDQSDIEKKKGVFRLVAGHNFVLFVSNMRNVNLTFITEEETSDATAAASEGESEG